jgi:ankyrin repeat protein
MIIDALENNNMWIFHALDIYPLPKEVIHILYSRAWLTNCYIEEIKKTYGYICFLVEISTKKGFDLLTNDLLNELKQLSAGNIYLQNGLIMLSANHGNLNMFKQLYELGVDCDFTICKAIENNHFHIVKFIVENNIKDIEIEHNSGTNPMDLAAETGNLEMFKYLEMHNIGECSEIAMDFAAKNGHLEMVKYLNENRNEGCSEYAMTFAIENNNLEIIEYLHMNRTEGCDYNRVEYILHKCTYETVSYLYDFNIL